MSLRVMDAVGIIGEFVADHWDQMSGAQDLQDELLHQGFSSVEIDEAFGWIESHTLGPVDPKKKKRKRKATAKELMALKPPLRVLANYERGRISPSGHGYLIGLYERGMIDVLQFDEILEKALRSSSSTVGLGEIKRLAALALFTKMQSDGRDLLHSKSSLVQ